MEPLIAAQLATAITSFNTLFGASLVSLEGNVTPVPMGRMWLSCRLWKKPAHLLDRPFMQQAIHETTQLLARLLADDAALLFSNMEKSQAREVVEDIQLHTVALRELLSMKLLSSHSVILEKIVTVLNPLQISLERAKFCLRSERPDEAAPHQEALWQVCYITGTTTLLAGYAFLGHELPKLKTELRAFIKSLHTRMLNDIALHLIPSRQDFPWDNVSQLLEPAGAETLLALYKATVAAPPISLVTDSLAVVHQPQTIREKVAL